MDIELQLEGASQVPLQKIDLDITEEGSEQDVCLAVPCRDGQLTEPMMLKATSRAGSSLNIDVSPGELDSNFEGLHDNSADCFGDLMTPADINVTCNKQEPGQYINTDILKCYITCI